ncbi:hypothetical protein IPM19_00630 [bacterium]|nr:MAG: hypothetical protein IPM19_00630 [bacterium]
MKILGLALLALGIWFFVLPLAGALWSVATLSVLLGAVMLAGGALTLGAGRPFKALWGGGKQLTDKELDKITDGWHKY